jgi:AraC-like DNA-binding protein
MENPAELAPHRIKEYTFEEALSGFTPKDALPLIRAYYHTYWNQKFPIGMHSHDFYEVNVISGGIGYHYLNDKCIKVSRGDVFVIPPIVKHGYYSDDKNFEIFHILLSNVFMERYKVELHELAGYSLLFETEPYIRRTASLKPLLSFEEDEFAALKKDFDELDSFEENPYKGIKTLQVAKTLYLIGIFCQKIQSSHQDTYPENEGSSNIEPIMKSMEYIQCNYGEKITIKRLCDIAHMSRSTFLRCFASLCKCTSREFIQEVRLGKAANFLKNSDEQISDIALDCGFYDSSHFTRSFIKKYGISPLQFRKEKEQTSPIQKKEISAHEDKEPA